MAVPQRSASKRCRWTGKQCRPWSDCSCRYYGSSNFTFFWCLNCSDLYCSQTSYCECWQSSMTKPIKWCAPNKDSDLPGHLPSLIQIFAVLMKKSWVLSFLLSTQQRLRGCASWSESSLGARHFVGFVVLQIQVSILKQRIKAFIIS